MLKKITALLFSLLLTFCLVFPVSAETSSFIVDDAGLLTSDEIDRLEQKAEQLESRYGIHAVVLTVNSLGGSRAQDFADDFYDRVDYGDDGVLFLLAMEEREWYVSTCGTVIYALTDYGIQQVGESVVPFLAEERWYDGFAYFLDSLPVYLDAYENRIPIDGYADYTDDYYHSDRDEIVYYEDANAPNFLLSLLCGIVISGIVVCIMRFSMNSRRAQRSAGEYVKEGSWNLTHHSDIFLYSNVTKTRKQDPPKNSGGGSSVHRSSGGRSHGGGGGKF